MKNDFFKSQMMKGTLEGLAIAIFALLFVGLWAVILGIL